MCVFIQDYTFLVLFNVNGGSHPGSSIPRVYPEKITLCILSSCFLNVFNLYFIFGRFYLGIYMSIRHISLNCMVQCKFLFGRTCMKNSFSACEVEDLMEFWGPFFYNITAGATSSQASNMWVFWCYNSLDLLREMLM